jgi:predicted TIM-barrel fold metal-dependent hydrolase
MRIWDAHIHLYPPDVYADPVAWGTAHREPWWQYCVAPPHKPTIQGWADVNELLRDMDAAGVEKVVLLGWYWEHQETCDLQNGWFIDWVKQHPDRILGFASTQPAEGQRSLDALERALDAGLCGIGEMLPQAQKFSFEDETWAKLVGIAQARRIPINIHVSDPVAIIDAITTPTPLENYIKLAQTFPDATFILAHWGGGLPFYEFNSRVRAVMKNVYYDTAASPLLYRSSIFRSVIDAIGADRILHGSDYPLLLYPGKSRVPDFSSYLDQIRAEAGLTAEEQEKIFSGNLARLLKA